MKKILMSSVALCGLVAVSAPAAAQSNEYVDRAGGLQLDVGGWYKGYGAFVEQDDGDEADVRNFDWLQATEFHASGETTLDNGLTVGAHIEAEADSDESFEVEESYAYFSGAWGRLNAGAENGAVYLMQVDAPSADANVDGIRQYISPVNYDALFSSDSTGDEVADLIITSLSDPDGSIFDYDDDVTAYANKATYLTPIFSGFQAGVSFTPEIDPSDDLEGVGTDDDDGQFGNTYEGALRYQGQYDAVGYSVGAGYTYAKLESEGTGFEDTDGDGDIDGDDDVISGIATDDRQSWNLGVDFDISAFGLGVAYVQDDLGLEDGDRDTLVVGGDYTTGPWKLGASYYNQTQELDFLGLDSDELDTDRYTGGVVYTYGPGMTFRGSISYSDFESDTLEDTDATSVLLGTQINF